MATTYENGLNLQATELRLGLPGVDDLQSEKQAPSSEYKNKKRNSAERDDDDCGSKSYSVISDARDSKPNIEPVAKHQVVGWPPVRHYRKNSFQQRQNENETMGKFVKVSMDGAPYLRKIDLNGYNGYMELLTALDSMFRFTMSQNSYFEGESCNRSEFKPTYEDKDGDWMLVGDVPWDMFSSSCKRLRIMRSSEARLSSSTDR